MKSEVRGRSLGSLKLNLPDIILLRTVSDSFETCFIFGNFTMS